MKKFNATVVTGMLVSAATLSVSEASNSTRPIMIGVTTDNLNIRSGPSAKYKILKEIKKGGSVEIYGSENGWYKVKYAGVNGWVSGKYVKEKLIESPTRYVSGVRREVLRDKPATGGTTYGFVYEGESVQVIDYSGIFARVKYKGRVYYMGSANLAKTHKSKTMYVSGKSKVDLMEIASASASVKGQIVEGTSVKMVGEKGNYYHVIYKNNWYYIEKTALINSDPSVIGFISDAEHVEVYSEDKKKVLGYLAHGQKVKRFKDINGYTRIRWNGETGLIKKSSCSFSEFVRKTVNSNSVKVMDSQSNTGKALGALSKNQVVEVYDKYADWSKVKINNMYGYVENKYLDEIKYVALDVEVPLRSTKSSSNSSNVVMILPKGAQVIVDYYTAEGWSRVKYGNKVGYVLNEHLYAKKQEVNEDTDSLLTGLTAVIEKEDVNLRKEANWGSDKLCIIKKGTEVQLIEKGDTWSKVKYEDKVGYVNNDYLKIQEIKTVIIEKEDVNLRKEANWGSDKLCIIKKGTEVQLIEKGDTWSKVKYEDKVGYVNNDYLNFKNENTPSDGGDLSEDIDGGVGYLDTIDIENPTINTRYTVNSSVKVYEDIKAEKLIGYLVRGAAIEEVSGGNSIISKCKINDEVVGYIKKSDISHRNPLVVNSESIITKTLSITHEEYLDTQIGKTYPTMSDIKKYSNPKNYSLSNTEQKYQFLKLDSYRNINISELNEYLNTLPVKSGQTAIFKNQAQAFISAAKKNNIDPIYLVAHTMLETGYGSSTLAQGVVVTKDSAGNSVSPTKVHNLYGIGAIDASAVESGAKVAYSLGWTSIPKAIEGAAKWIATGVSANPSVGLKESQGYIHSEKFTHQYTLYSMRWDYIYGWHQYASDPQWAIKISRLMSQLSYMYEGAKLTFENIIYKQSPSVNMLSKDGIDKVVLEDSVLRTGPSDNYKVVGNVNKGDIVSVKGYSEKYALIEYCGEDFYVENKILGDINSVDKLESNKEEVIVNLENTEVVNEDDSIIKNEDGLGFDVVNTEGNLEQ